MRSLKEVEGFHYKQNTVCYIEVDKNGNVSQVHHKNKSDRPELLAAYQRAVKNLSVLYVVWPGQWSSDLFIVDDLDSFAKNFGLTTSVTDGNFSVDIY